MNTSATEPELGPIPTSWIVAAWIAFGVIDGSQTVFGMYAQGMHHEWLKLFVLHFVSWSPWLIATPFLLRLGVKRPLRSPGIRNWGAHVLMLVLMLVVGSCWFVFLDVMLDPWLEPPPRPSFANLLRKNLYSWILPTFVLYAFILAVGTVVRARASLALQKIETARLNEQLANAQLNALRQQFEPHFLFNALNSIVALMREQRTQVAIRALVSLSDFLRGTLNESRGPLVALSKELDLLQPYLDIQKTRFGDRVTIEIDVPEILHTAAVPSPILQPLVENAIKHGIERKEQGGRIAIRATQLGELLTVRVFNDGPPLVESSEPTSLGIGLKNLRTRLTILFGTRFDLDLRNCEGGVEALVAIPMSRIER